VAYGPLGFIFKSKRRKITMEEKKAKLVFNAGVVRKLLKAGCRIIDVKADRDNKDKTVFVFERDEAFEKAFSDINEELKKAKEEN
jgi:hypothetical protein